MEIPRVGAKSHREQRSTVPIQGEVEGYAKDDTGSWYVLKKSGHSFEIHRAAGLKYEKAPPPSMEED